MISTLVTPARPYPLVLLPIPRKVISGRELAAGYFQCDFHAPVPDVVKVLHAPEEGIPLCPVGDPLGEARLALAGPAS
jgi:hypothetical protein